MKGTVQAISAKDFNGTLLYSAKVGENWVGLGANKPEFNKGDFIELEVTTNNRGRLVAVDGSIRPVKQGTVQVIEGSKTWAKNAKDEYWTRREERDIHTQAVIQLQASRNSAIALANVMLTAGAVPGYDKAAANKKMDIILALLEDLTTKFEDESTVRRAKSEGKEAAAEAEAPTTEDSSESDIWGG